MAAGVGGTPPPPLRLKDLLELDCDSCSAAGFRCYPRRLGGESASAPMRHLLESSSPSSLRLRPHRTSSKLSLLSRSLSRRLSRRGGGLWSRRHGEEDAAAATATAGCGCGSSTTEEMDTLSSESSDRRSRSESDSDFSSATDDSVLHHHHPSQAAGAGDEHEVVVAMKRVVSKERSSSGSEADDKEHEQLSPVAVMDFPFDRDDEEDELRDDAIACSPPSFSLERLQRRKTYKIRRFESLDELPPLGLEARLADTSDPAAAPPQQQQQQQMMIQCRAEDAAAPTCAGSVVHDVPHHHDDDVLISLLKATPVSAGGLDDASERLLLDFFVETMKRRAHAAAELLLLPLPGPAAGGVLRRKAERVVDDEQDVAAAARDWLEGAGTERWGLTDVLSGGAAIVAEMDRGRRWMQVGEEEREVGAMVAGMLLDQLVAEVVRCLFA